jgi:hypothetical protein
MASGRLPRYRNQVPPEPTSSPPVAGIVPHVPLRETDNIEGFEDSTIAGRFLTTGPCPRCLDSPPHPYKRAPQPPQSSTTAISAPWYSPLCSEGRDDMLRPLLPIAAVAPLIAPLLHAQSVATSNTNGCHNASMSLGHFTLRATICRHMWASPNPNLSPSGIMARFLAPEQLQGATPVSANRLQLFGPRRTRGLGSIARLLFHELGPHDFLLQNNSLFPRKSHCFCIEPPELHRNSSSVLGFKSEPIFSHHFASSPLNLVQITCWSLSFYTKAL